MRVKLLNFKRVHSIKFAYIEITINNIRNYNNNYNNENI